jgi:hypothetical protein
MDIRHTLRLWLGDECLRDEVCFYAPKGAEEVDLITKISRAEDKYQTHQDYLRGYADELHGYEVELRARQEQRKKYGRQRSPLGNEVTHD